MVALPLLDPVTSLRFAVTIDGDDLGTFSACEGLGAQIDMMEYREGGQNGFTYKLPGRLSFTPIVLTRAVDGQKGSLAPWFTAFSKNRGGGKTGAITAYDGMGLQVIAVEPDRRLPEQVDRAAVRHRWSGRCERDARADAQRVHADLRHRALPWLTAPSSRPRSRRRKRKTS